MQSTAPVFDSDSILAVYKCRSPYQQKRYVGLSIVDPLLSAARKTMNTCQRNSTRQRWKKIQCRGAYQIICHFRWIDIGDVKFEFDRF